LKTLTYYHETKKLLGFIAENYGDYSLAAIKTILTDAKEKIEEKNELEVSVKNLNLRL
jgi:hypothetical protein